MRQYIDLLKDIILQGKNRPDRTGTGTRSLFSPRAMRFDLQTSFPLITTKKVPFRWIKEELLWFLTGHQHINYLKEKGVEKIWAPWADENGHVGPLYPTQFRRQLPAVIGHLRADPYSRRHILSTWQVDDLPLMCLPPCHGLVVQFYVSENPLGEPTYLSCHMYQRSADVFIGLPWNIASYALLTRLVADQCGLKPQTLIVTLGDAHIYRNHMEQVLEQVSRKTRPLPWLCIKTLRPTIFEYDSRDIRIMDYSPHPAIKGEVSV